MKLKSLIMVLVLSSCRAWAESPSASELLHQVIKTAEALKDCQCRFRVYSSSRRNPELYLKMTEEAKYLRQPLLYYQKRISVEANYPEQAQAGFQEIYRGDQDLTELLMPGVFRALGLIKLFPEDPKAYGVNGENLKSMAPWDLLQECAQLAKTGTLELKSARLNEQPYLLFTILPHPEKNYFDIKRIQLYVDPKSLLPKRLEQYYLENKKPGFWIEYDSLVVNSGLSPEQIKFEGFKNPFSLITTPSAQEVEPWLKPIARTRLPEPAADPQIILNHFHQAVDAINSYRADLSLRFRYFRLRLYREDRFAYNRNPYWFTLVTTAQKANYLLLNHSAGAVLWIDPGDKNFHLIGGGVQRLLGEQIFSTNDYKFYSSLGDNPYELNLINLRAMIKNDFTNCRAQSWTVEYQDRKMWELLLFRTGETPPRHPGKINLVIDPEINLPKVIELSGYEDPKALMAMTIDNIKTNISLKPGASKF